MRAGMDVGSHEDRAKVLGVNRLGLPLAAGHLLRERRPDGQETGAELSRDHDAFGPADELVKGDDARVKRVSLARLEPHPMASADLVDEDDQLTFCQRFQSGLWARIKQCQYA